MQKFQIYRDWKDPLHCYDQGQVEQNCTLGIHMARYSSSAKLHPYTILTHWEFLPYTAGKKGTVDMTRLPGLSTEFSAGRPTIYDTATVS